MTPASVKSLKHNCSSIHIGWLDQVGRTRPIQVKGHAGGIRILKLELSKNYSVRDVIEEAKNIFLCEKTLERHKSTLQYHLSYNDGTIISSFTNLNDEPCDLWTFYKCRGLVPYRSNLYLLTKDETNTVDIKKDSSVDSLDVPANITVLYHDIKVSKYTKLPSVMEKDKTTLFEELPEDLKNTITFEEFDPIDYGYSISSISKGDKIFLQIYIKQDRSRLFTFPSSSVSDFESDHIVLVDSTELCGMSCGKLGVGTIPSCTDKCQPLFTWYKDDVLYKEGLFLYWVDVPNEGCVTSCIVQCRRDDMEKEKETIVSDESEQTEILSINESVSDTINQQQQLVERDAKLIGILSTFLNVHPFGAGLDYIWSYLSKFESNLRPLDIEMFMSRFPVVFKQEVVGIGANIERRWIFNAFNQNNE